MKAFVLSLAFAPRLAIGAQAALDPTALMLTFPDQVHWTGRAGGPETAFGAGDPNSFLVKPRRGSAAGRVDVG